MLPIHRCWVPSSGPSEYKEFLKHQGKKVMYEVFKFSSHLFQSCRLLEKMDLEECILITDTTLMHLGMGCPRLEKLVSIT